ncbi:MAG: methyltransferase domain-containing protein [Acidobacteria bacterium]|nr:methyltransferase domain-containing protein [Acidobacteriota bacterium]
MKNLPASIEAHYSRGPSIEFILENLQRKGIPRDRVCAADLYAYDQLHAGGIEATRRLAAHGGIRSGSIVVDVGCGNGGAARYLHYELACRVFGLELTAARLRTAHLLNQLSGNTPGIHLAAASADALPFLDGFADVVWTQHVTMNLPDHAAFLSECWRVLKPSGRYVCHEWFRNRSGELPFPVPWAPEPALNHTALADQFLHWLHKAGFASTAEDVTQTMCQALERDIHSLKSAGGADERVAAIGNLVHAASDGRLCCLMITSGRLKKS